MSIKFKYSYSKPLDGSRWKHLVAIIFHPDEVYPDDVVCREFGEDERDKVRDYLTQQKKFLKFMDESYGTQEKRWSVRWSDYGADVRFDSAADAGSFVMCFTEELSKIR
jgi:hypothetical protein